MTLPLSVSPLEAVSDSFSIGKSANAFSAASLSDELADKFRQRHLFMPYYLVKNKAANQKQQEDEYPEHNRKDDQSRFHFSHFPSVIRPAFTHYVQVKTKSRIIFIKIAR